MKDFVTDLTQTQPISDPPDFIPGPVLLLGAPGVGKGTQAKLLMEHLSIPQISTGDLLRSNRQDQTEFGRAAETLMQRGELVPDDLVNGMVARRLEAPDCTRGYVLDGFPRTLVQAAWLDQYLGSLRTALPVVAISIQVDQDDLLKRITGRRISSSGRIYNIYWQPPRTPGKDDVDGSPLEQRADDTELVFEQRMRTFAEQTAPVVEHYRKAGRFEEVDGSLGIAEVSADIVQTLRRLRETAR